MNFLEERIVEDGQIRPGNVLKVDSFLNHQLDVKLLDEIGEYLFAKFKDAGITRVMTIEASGIAIATSCARVFGVPAVFAKKSKSKNLDGDLYRSTVHSYTYDKDYPITLSKKYLTKDDCVLIVDDFLATGNAMFGLLDVCKQAGAKVGGIGIAIEKSFQDGGKTLREQGYALESVARIAAMSPEDGITFVEEA